MPIRCGPGWPSASSACSARAWPPRWSICACACGQPRRKVSELLELFGLQLWAALIDQTVHQAARSVAPLEQQLAHQLEQAVLVHADETSWAEAKLALWLWYMFTGYVSERDRP